MGRGQYLQLLTEKTSFEDPDSYKERNLGKVKVHKILLAKGRLLDSKPRVTTTRMRLKRQLGQDNIFQSPPRVPQKNNSKWSSLFWFWVASYEFNVWYDQKNHVWFYSKTRKEESRHWVSNSDVIPHLLTQPGLQIYGASFSVLEGPWKEEWLWSQKSVFLSIFSLLHYKELYRSLLRASLRIKV